MEAVRRGYIPTDEKEFGTQFQQVMDTAGQEVAYLLNRGCIRGAASTCWVYVPAVVKNMFDRLPGAAMEETETFPRPCLSRGQKYILLTATLPFRFHSSARRAGDFQELWPGVWGGWK